MDKSMVNQFTSHVEQLRNTECDQKQKISCFQHIAECIMSPALAGHINYATYINMATTVLLLFCEDLDPMVRMNAEENLNRIFRSLENTRVSRILMDLYGEIKRNGNYRSLRICLNLFAYYAPQIREKNIKWYAVRLSPCLQTIAQRKETQLCETLCDFVKSFGKYLQMGLTDSESCKLFEAFVANVGAECAVKRRCSAQNCISLIENSRNKSLMARHGLKKAVEFLLTDQQQHNILGTLGFLRLLLPLIIHGFHTDCPDDCEDCYNPQKHAGIKRGKPNSSMNTEPQRAQIHTASPFITSTYTSTSTSTTTTSTSINKECRQIIEIFDYCLHLLNVSSASQHSIINAALEVINAVLLALDAATTTLTNCNKSNNSTICGNVKNNNSDLVKSLYAALCNQQLQHAEYLRRRKSLKNQIFQLRNYEVSAAMSYEEEVNTNTVTVVASTDEKCKRMKSTKTTSTWKKGNGSEEIIAVELSEMGIDSEGEVEMRRAPNIRHVGRSISECVVDDDDDDDEAHRTILSTDLVAIAHTDANIIGRDVYADGIVGGVLVDMDDDDFTTLSDINEPQQLRASTAVAMAPPSYALTTTIDVDNLIDAIDSTPATKTQTIKTTITTTTTETSNASSSNSSRVVHTKMQSIQPQNQEEQKQQNEKEEMHERQVKPQNLLTAPIKQISAADGVIVSKGGGSGGSGSSDDKSQHFSDIDNESFNSIDFEAEITIAGMSGISVGENRSPKAMKADDIYNNITTIKTSPPTAVAVDNATAGNNKLSSSGSSDTIGSFFNNLISNAASESMSKLFRPSTGVRATPTKSMTTTTPTTSENIDESASNISASTSMAFVDNISLISTTSTSGNKILDLNGSTARDPQSDSTPHTYTQSIASSSLGMHDDTVSTALLVDASLHSRDGSGGDADDDDDGDSKNTADSGVVGGQREKVIEAKRIPNANPFLTDKSIHKNSTTEQLMLSLKIGTLFEQSIIRYTTRLIAARFLLTGQAGCLRDDTQIRISIKSISLSVLGYCVRFDPEVLQLTIEISERELCELSNQAQFQNPTTTTTQPSPSKSSSASGSPSIPQSDESVSGSSSNLGKDYEHLDAVDFIKNKKPYVTAGANEGVIANELPAELQLLEIKDDHFGKSNFDYLLYDSTNNQLSKSADPVLMSQQISGMPKKLSTQKSTQICKLSKSENMESEMQRKQQKKLSQSLTTPFRVTEAVEDFPPQMLPPRPPKRTKSQRKSIAAATVTVAALEQIDELTGGRSQSITTPLHPQQYLADVLLYHNHTDPMLRGGVQQIIGGFIGAIGKADLNTQLQLNVQHLLAMLIKGLQDDIHTVVIQALNAFEKIFPYVVYKYLILPITKTTTATITYHQQKQQQKQQPDKDIDTEGSASLAVVFVDKSGRKCHANADGQVLHLQQQNTNDEQNSSNIYTHVHCKASAEELDRRSKSVNAKTCASRMLFNDNDELIEALLNDFQLQSKLNRSNSNSNNNSNNNNEHKNNDYTNNSTQTQTTIDGHTISCSSNSPHSLPLGEFRISPKLLLSKLRLCHYNKYWLVQNKYAEVISNLNYAALHATCNDCHGYCCGTAFGCECHIASGNSVVVVGDNDVAEEFSGNAGSNNSKLNVDKTSVNTSLPACCSSVAMDDDNPATWKSEEMSYNILDDNVCIYESQFMDELLHLIGDDDFRVREHAALCLCRFIIQNAKHQQQQITNANNNTLTSIDLMTGPRMATNKIGYQYPVVGPFGGCNDVDVASAAGVGVGAAAVDATSPTSNSASGDNKSFTSATYETNFNLLWDFFDYRLFSGLPLPLRNLFRAMSTPALSSTNVKENITTTTTTNTIYRDAGGGDFAESLCQRYRAEEEKLLAKVLYRMTNKLMELDDKNTQFGIIYTLKLLLEDFNFIDYQRAWMEFNFIEICQRFSYHNYITAVDLACQNDLIDVTGKLMAGYLLSATLHTDRPDRVLQQQLDQLLVHVMKILNIYYHIITQQKPLLFVKVQKSDLFPNAKELALVQSLGYFGSEFVYIKLYSMLKSANDSYKITINHESGRLLISLLRTCLNTLSVCIEMRTNATPIMASTPTGNRYNTPSHGSQHINSPSGGSGSSSGGGARDTSPIFGASHSGIGSSSGSSSGISAAVYPSNATLKLIEEILQYLSKLVNYAPGECIACLRQLLKYLFGQNYGNQQRDYYATFIRPYFVVRNKGQQLQLHLQQQQQQQQRNLQQKQRRPSYDRPHKEQKQQQQQQQQQLLAQQEKNSSTAGEEFTTQTEVKVDHNQQPMTMLNTINSKTTQPAAVSKTLAFSSALGIVRSAATIGNLATALQGSKGHGGGDGGGGGGGVGGNSLSTPTMTTSNVTYNETNIIGKQSTYANENSPKHMEGVQYGDTVTANQINLNAMDYYRLMGEVFASGLNLQTLRPEQANECVKHIKLFEPLVIYSLMLFLKSNARIQAPILELLHQLLELNVTYSVLDSKNVIFDQILNSLDLIENGIVRNGPLIIPPMIKFLTQLTHKSDRKLITIPKIISITNNLLANNTIINYAVIALKSLAYEIFFMSSAGGSNTIALTATLADYRAPFQSPVTRSPVQQHRHVVEDASVATAAAEALLANSRELDTQKEVILGMLEKFIDANELQSVVALLLLRERSAQHLDGGIFARQTITSDTDGNVLERQKGKCNLESTLLQDPSVVYALICRAMCDGRLNVHDWRQFYILESCFKNYSKYVLADSKHFTALLELFLTEDVKDFSVLAQATIILANVILKTEEIYLVNHIKLYLKNHPEVQEREYEHSKNKDQQQQQHTTAHWLLDGPSTSSAAARAATQTYATNHLTSASSTGGGSISEINFFAKVLCQKLENCLDVIISAIIPAATAMPPTTNSGGGACSDMSAYCQLVCRFVNALHEFCCHSRHKDALQSVFRFVLAESSLLDKYCNFIALDKWHSRSSELEGGNNLVHAVVVVGNNDSNVPTVAMWLNLQLEVLKLLSAMKLLDPLVMLQLLEQQKQKSYMQKRQQLQKKQQQQQQQHQHEMQMMTTNKERVKWYANIQRTLLSEICQQKPNVRDWTVQQVQQLLNAGGATAVNFLITDNFEFVSDLCEVAATTTTATQTEISTIKEHNVREKAIGSGGGVSGVGGEVGALWLNALLQHANFLNKRSIRALPPLLLRLCKATTLSAKGGIGISKVAYNLEFILLSLQLLHYLHTRCKHSRAMMVRLERLVRRLVFNCGIVQQPADLPSPLHDAAKLLRQLEKFVEDQAEQKTSECSISNQFWQQLLLDTKECKLAAQPLAEQQKQQQNHTMIDEKWLLNQLIKSSAQPDYGAQQLSRILLEIQSEQKLYKIFNSKEFPVTRVLRHAIANSMQAMLTAFQNNCIQYNSHIHYMQPNPLVRVTCAMLMTRISAEIAVDNKIYKAKVPTTTKTATTTMSLEETSNENQKCAPEESSFYLCDAVTTLLNNIRKVEENALLYIEARFIDKFVREQLLRPENVATLLHFLDWCCRQVQQQVMQNQRPDHTRQHNTNIQTVLQCIAALLQQRFIWMELNQMEKPTTTTTTVTTVHDSGTTQNVGPNNVGNVGDSVGDLLTFKQRSVLLCRILDILVLILRRTLQHTIFYRQYKQQTGDLGIAGIRGNPIFDDVETQTIFNAIPATAAAANELESILHIENDSHLSDIAVGRLLQAYAPHAIFIAKLIEMRGMKCLSAAYLTGGSSGKGGTLNNGVGAGGGGSMGIESDARVSANCGGTANNACCDFECGNGSAQISMDILIAIGIAVMRSNQFYAYAVTPFEIIMQQQQNEQRIEQLSPSKNVNQTSSQATFLASTTTTTTTTSCGKLPTIPVECLSDVDVLRKFVKRLSIFGFTTRQQFEEYFMTFLLLINKVYDENMVDKQEQFQIRSTCLEAILELLITYKTFPIVGNKLSHFHHTTRWTRINCDSISLKKLHKVQLLVSEANIFYHPNLERQLSANYFAQSSNVDALCQHDTVIGTSQFRVNQYDLNFIWQQMEAYAQNTATTNTNNANDTETLSTSSIGGDGTTVDRKRKCILSGITTSYNEDTATKNYRYSTTQSGVDFKSSTQLIFDVLMQIIESNHILVLPNLVKFTEICESRDQIKWIKDKALKLQETIPMDDTISHQHLIYLLCKTQAMLIPTLSELQQLCQLIGNYLKSSHIFIRNATLAGLLCLLECCSKTNTTIGKLSEELALLRDLIVGYINRHGIIDESSMQCSDTHTKLVWTLNYCLIEWTSKFVPQCPLLSNTIIAAGNFLKKTNNENVYLCVLHGLERIVVISNSGTGNTTGASGSNNAHSLLGVGLVAPVLRNKIEKLALELVKLENERFSIPALKLLLSCIYVGSAKQLENTELSNGIVQDEPEIIAQQADKVDILLHCIKSSTRDAAWIYGQVLCQIIRDLVPPNEILTKVIKEFLAINQPHCDVIAMIVHQVFRCAIDSTFLQMLQDWLICSLPTFLALPERKGVWCLSVIFLSASINLHLIKLFPVLLSTGSIAAAAASTAIVTTTTTTTTTTFTKSSSTSTNGSGISSNSGGFNPTDSLGTNSQAMVWVCDGEFHKLGQHEIALFVTAAADFHAKLSGEQRIRFRDAFEKFQRQPVYAKLLQNL